MNSNKTRRNKEEVYCNNEERHHDAIDLNYAINKIISFPRAFFFSSGAFIHWIEKKTVTNKAFINDLNGFYA